MASKVFKTCSLVLYGLVTLALLCVVLVLLFKDDKGNCSNPKLSSSAELSRLLNGTTMAASNRQESTDAAAEPEVDFTGRFELYLSENFDEFLSELGISYFVRVVATRASSEYQITKENGTYSLRTVSTFGESLITFKSGVSFKENRLDGNVVDTVIDIVGNKWIQKQAGEKEVTIVREFSAEGIVVTSFVNNVTCVRKYRRL